MKKSCKNCRKFNWCERLSIFTNVKGKNCVIGGWCQDWEYNYLMLVTVLVVIVSILLMVISNLYCYPIKDSAFEKYELYDVEKTVKPWMTVNEIEEVYRWNERARSIQEQNPKFNRRQCESLEHYIMYKGKHANLVKFKRRKVRR